MVNCSDTAIAVERTCEQFDKCAQWVKYALTYHCHLRDPMSNDQPILICLPTRISPPCDRIHVASAVASADDVRIKLNR
jgi:hypothetical protein